MTCLFQCVTRVQQCASANRGHRSVWAMGVAIAALLAGCATPPPSTTASEPTPVALPTQAEPPPVVVQAEEVQAPITGPISHAKTPKEYRRDAAAHLYAKHKDRIYKGRMPPLLYAVGTLHVGVNNRGQVDYVQWMRAPSHAPEVMAEIEKMVRAAAPYPAAIGIGGVVYTDTWLWDKTGRFQLDTLTEGQDGVVRSRPVAQNIPVVAPAKPATPTAAVKPVAKAPEKPAKNTKPVKKPVVVANKQ